MIDKMPDFKHFSGIESWIFDLDNTLYPRHTDLFKQVDRKISEYVSRLLDIAHDDARAVQKKYYRKLMMILRKALVTMNLLMPSNWPFVII